MPVAGSIKNLIIPAVVVTTPLMEITSIRVPSVPPVGPVTIVPVPSRLALAALTVIVVRIGTRVKIGDMLAAIGVFLSLGGLPLANYFTILYLKFV